MSVEGWYYLHTNGSLLYRRRLDERTETDIVNSDLAVSMWPVDPEDRRTAWRICIEASALGADAERIYALVRQWGCDDEDALSYAQHISLRLEHNTTRGWMTGTHNCKYGASAETALKALVILCRSLGYVGGKPPPKSFEDLLKEQQDG